MSKVYVDSNDDRVSLAEVGVGVFITLKNIYTGCEEKFTVEKEKGRGGSCIVYEASNRTQNRKVLLKEFYPLNRRKTFVLVREESTFALRLKEEKKEGGFKKAKDNFLEVCQRQMKFYNDNASENADELKDRDIQGIYNLGDTVLLMTSFDDGCSWDCEKFRDDNLYQIFETSLSLLRQLELYHADELVHCDVKPANIYIFNNTRQIVRLLDFGSVLDLQKGYLTGEEPLSYTEDFAAPELIEANLASESNRENYYSCITTKVDLFSFGALLYKKILGCCIPRGSKNFVQFRCNKDVEKFWNLEKNGRVKNVPEHVKATLIKLLVGLLTEDISHRFGIEETREYLRVLLKDTRLPEFCLSLECKAPRPSGDFIGRDMELKELKYLLECGEKNIFIFGDGGLGKSQLALKLAWEERNNFEFFRTVFNGDLKQTIADLQTDPPYPLNENEGYNLEDIFWWNMRCLRQQGDRTVLIIDDFDLSPEEMGKVLYSEIFGSLQKMGMKFIFTCRHRPPQESGCVEVLSLPKDDLLQLMHCYYQGEDYNDSLSEIIEVVQCNTLVVEQIARILQQSWRELSPEILLEKLKKGVDKEKTVTSTLKSLFNISKLSKKAKEIMAHAVLLPIRGMRAALFLSTHNESQQDKIRLLELSGWLKKSTDNFIYIHPLVREVCISSIDQFCSGCKIFIEKYFSEYSRFSIKDRVKYTIERMELISNAADLLGDFDSRLIKLAGDFSYNCGYALEALHYFQKYLEIRRSDPQLDILEELDLSNRLAQCASNMSDFSGAVSYLESALHKAASALGEDRVELLRYYKNLADIYRKIDNLEKAGEIYAKVLHILKGVDEIDDYTLADIYINYAKFCLQIEEIDTAKRYVKKAMGVLQHDDEKIPAKMMAEIDEIFAEFYLKHNSWEYALSSIEKAKRLYELFYGKEHPVTGSCYRLLARILIAMERSTEALDYLDRARKILVERYGEEHAEVVEIDKLRKFIP